MPNCDFCERPISTGSGVCDHCGRPQATRAEIRSKWIRVIAIVVVTLVVMVAWQRFVGFQRQ